MESNKGLLCKIRDLQQEIRTFEHEFETQFGICMNEGMAICSIEQAGSLTSGELVRLLGLTNSNTSKILKSIEQKGLVKRLIGKSDKRQMNFILTETGKETIRKILSGELQLPEGLDKIIRNNP